MTLLGQEVATCGVCGEPVLSTDPRLSAHGPLDYAKHIGGSEFDALVKQAGYVPDGRYGYGGSYEAPWLVHTRCASEELLAAYRKVGALD